MSIPTQTYVGWEAVHARVAQSLFLAPSELHAAWQGLCAQAAKDAASEIKRILIGKGYTPAQVAASDDARVWNERLAAFFAFQRGATYASYDLKSLEFLDPRKDMAEAGAIVIDDAAVAPTVGASDVGGIGYGEITAVTTARCRFDAF